MRIGYNLGFAVRETGQALDRLGCVIQGTAPFLEEGLSCFDLVPAAQPVNSKVPKVAVVQSPDIEHCKTSSTSGQALGKAPLLHPVPP